MIKIKNNEIYKFISVKLNFRDESVYEAALKSYYFDKHHLARLVLVTGKVLPHIKLHSKVLDLGSDGIFPFMVKNLVEDVETFAVSKSTFSIEFTEDGHASKRENFQFEDAKNIINIQECNLDKDRLPFDDNSIDIITCFEVLEHIHADPMHMILEAKRVLKKPDGIFLLSTPNINSLKSLKRILNLENPYFWPPYCITDLEIGHTKEYSVNELKLLFKKSGFSILGIETYNHEEDGIFSHDKLYQSGGILGIEKNVKESQFNKFLYDFLDSINWDRRLQGDYILIKSKWKTDDYDKHYFPLYETY